MGQFDIEFLRQNIDISKYPCVVETGTLHGDSAQRISESFSRVHTIEIHPTLYANACKRFRGRSDVTCHYGDSATVLPTLFPQLTTPTIFYLDAHWSGDRTTNWAESNWKGYGIDTGYRIQGPVDDTPSSRAQVPLEEEILSIASRFSRECVIYIDDMDKFDASGNGLRNKGFNGEDWSHLNFQSLLQKIGDRVDFTHFATFQCVIGIKAA
jgi:hypothetical protein